MAFWVTAALWAGFTLLSVLTAPKPSNENAKPAGAGDFNFPTSQEGRPWALLFGTVKILGPNTMWWGDKSQKAIKQKVKSGFFSSSSVIKGYRYYFGVQLGYCRGGEYPVDEGRQVWIGDKVVYDGGGADPVIEDGDTFTIDKPELFGGDDFGTGGFKGTFKFFAGSLAQAASAYLAPFQTVAAQQIAYRGRCYIAPATESVYIGNGTNVAPIVMELRRTPNPLALGSATVNGLDANPMNVLYLVLTSNDFPFRIDPAQVDSANFVSVGGVLNGEGNGFSMLLDRTEQAIEMVKRIEDQVDGALYYDVISGLWRFRLARADYDPNTIDELNETNIKEVSKFSRGSWEETINEVRVKFYDRADGYKEKPTPPAQDGANIRIQDGLRIPALFVMAGIKDATLATNVAWRKLRAKSRPLAVATIITNRSTYAANKGDVFAVTRESLGLVKLPMRVTRVNKGNIHEGYITLDLVEAGFFYATASGGEAQVSLWTPPVDVLEAFDADEQLAIEAPRALTLRDPDTTDPSANKILAAARRHGPEARFAVYQRTNPSTPSFSGTPVEIGEVYGFTLIGELASSLPVGSAYPFNNLAVVPTPDSGSALVEAFPTGLSVADVGTELSTLLLIDNEFFLVTGAVTQPGANLDIDGVYRGVLDSAQQAHASGAKVYLLFVGAGMSLAELPETDYAEIRLAPESSSDELDPLDAGVTAIVFQMRNRTRRPYPPSELSLNGTRFSASAGLEGAGSGEGIGIQLAFLRRDFRALDEIASLGVDAATLFADFPTANSTTHEVDVYNVSGSPVLLFTTSLAALTTAIVTRLSILLATDGDLPTALRFRLRSKHDFEGEVQIGSYYDLVWDFAVTSGLTGQFEFTALDTNDVSSVYTTTVAGINSFTLSSAFTSGNVEHRINGGAWLPLILAGTTSGVTASLIIGDTIEIRHLSPDVAALKLLTMNAAGAGQDAFAVLFT